MISVLRDIFMADELPSGDKAVYVFLEISAFCFALASVDALATRHWVASIAYLLVAVVFYLGGIKWPQIRSGATRIVRRRDAATNSQSTLPLDDKPPTLVDLFMKEFPNTLRSSDNEDGNQDQKTGLYGFSGQGEIRRILHSISHPSVG